MFKGYFRNDIFDGFGQFTWALEEGQEKPNIYEGYWKDGKMDGGGEFRNQYQSQLKGLFKNNLYSHLNHLFLNPFASNEANRNFVSNAESYQIHLQKVAKEEFERVRLLRVKGSDGL